MTTRDAARAVYEAMVKELEKPVWRDFASLPAHTGNAFIDIIEAALTQARAEGLVWSTEKPTVPGWYWWMAEGYEPSVHYVDIVDGYPEAIYSDNGDNLLEDFAGQWAGPLSPPTQEP